MDEPRFNIKQLQELGSAWMDRIKRSEDREDKWLKDAAAAETAYLCGQEAENSANEGDVPEFNILHSNVETIVPSIYNSTPAPDIRPRHNARDEMGRQTSNVFERAIATQVDDNRLDSEIEASAQDAFMAGRGVVRVKFDAQVSETSVTGEIVEYEVVSWRDYREGPAKRWKAVPWVAYRHCISQEDMDAIEDADIRGVYMSDETYTEAENKELDVDVWEIWDKERKQVVFVIADNMKVIKVEDDPLGLSGFFPQTEPVQPISGTGKRTPVCPYKVYKTLADELDKITRRINAIVSGLKVRGGVPGNAESLEELAQAGDNELIPIANVEGLVAQGGLEKAVIWWPVEKAIVVLRELYVQRDQTKQTIYEITGISDIIRGQGNAAETATAQQIKTEWGSLRIKKMQRLIERQVRDLFKITAEIIAQHFTAETLQKVSGIEITPEMQAFVQRPLDHYRIDVESDSTIRADVSRNQSVMAEFLQGTAQFMSAMAPVVQGRPEALPVVVTMYAAFARQFNLGKDAEDALEGLIEMAQNAPPEPDTNPEADAQAAEMALKEREIAKGEQEAAERMQLDREQFEHQKQVDFAQIQHSQQTEAAKFALERQKESTASIFRRDEMDMAKREKGLITNQGEDAMTTFSAQLQEIVQAAVAESTKVIIAAQQQQAEALQAGQQQIAQALSAPKELIRDESGRPVGVRPATIN